MAELRLVKGPVVEIPASRRRGPRPKTEGRLYKKQPTMVSGRIAAYDVGAVGEPRSANIRVIGLVGRFSNCPYDLLPFSNRIQISGQGPPRPSAYLNKPPQIEDQSPADFIVTPRSTAFRLSG